MKSPSDVRLVTEAERLAGEAGLCSTDPFVRRRCQIVLASADHTSVPAIAQVLRCNDQTVHNAIHAFTATGVAALPARRLPPAHDPCRLYRSPGQGLTRQAKALRDLLPRSPRDVGQDTSLGPPRWRPRSASPRA